MAECGTRAFVTRGRVPLGSWQALLRSCGVRVGGEGAGRAAGRGYPAAYAPTEFGRLSWRVPTLGNLRYLAIWNLIISDCLLQTGHGSARL